MDFRQTLFKYRSYAPIPFLIVMVLIAQPTGTSLLSGFFLVIVGELIRLWGVSLAGSETRTRGAVGGSQLVSHGPFAHVRNPLYLGNMLIYFGIGIMANTPLLAFFALIYFFFQYSLIVSLEEESLFRIFGGEYIDYFQAVPRFVPTFKKYKGGNPSQPELDLKKGLNSERSSLLAICITTVLLLVLWYVRG